MRELNLIGAGKVGQVLARCWWQAGVATPQRILNRSTDSAAQAAAWIGAGAPQAADQSFPPASLWMLSVSDDQIAAVAQQLADSQVLRPGDVVFHCSGAKASAVLAPVQACGALIASLHPVRSFADKDACAAAFAGTVCSLEGDEGALQILESCLHAIAAETVRIRAEDKLVYHAAAVFASNYLVTLMDTALAAYEAAGIPRDMAQKMAEPLARLTMENVFRIGTEKALTGPVARGDWALVRQQSAAVHGWQPEAGQLYDAMVTLTAALAARHHSAK